MLDSIQYTISNSLSCLSIVIIRRDVLLLATDSVAQSPRATSHAGRKFYSCDSMNSPSQDYTNLDDQLPQTCI